MLFKRKNSHGAAAVEFGIVLPVLMLVLMGTIDWGYYFYSHEVITNAAREGARAGSVDDPSGTLDFAATAKSAASTYVQKGGLDPAKYAYDALVTTESVRVTVTCNQPVSSLTGFLSSLSLYPTSQQAIAEMRR